MEPYFVEPVAVDAHEEERLTDGSTLGVGRWEKEGSLGYCSVCTRSVSSC